MTTASRKKLMASPVSAENHAALFLLRTRTQHDCANIRHLRGAARIRRFSAPQSKLATIEPSTENSVLKARSQRKAPLGVRSAPVGTRREQCRFPIDAGECAARTRNRSEPHGTGAGCISIGNVGGTERGSQKREPRDLPSARNRPSILANPHRFFTEGSLELPV